MSRLIVADSSVLFHFSIKLEDVLVADSTALHGKPARLLDLPDFWRWFAPHIPQGLSSWEQDNWRDNNRQTVSREVLSCFDFCGDELQIIRKTERHTECSLTWRMYFADWADEDRSSSYVWFFGYEVGCDVIDTDNQETKKIH